jgi:hypothetical protein
VSVLAVDLHLVSAGADLPRPLSTGLAVLMAVQPSDDF